VQQPPNPATASSMRSRRSERSLTALAQGVSGAATFPTFLPPSRTATDDPETIQLPWRTGRRENCRRLTRPGRLSFSLAFWFKRERANPLVRLSESEVAFTPSLHGVLHHPLHLYSTTINSGNQRITRRGEDRTVRGPNPSEAGATHYKDARCVTVSLGSLPPHQFSEGTTSLPRLSGLSAISTTGLDAYMVNVARNARFTLAFTDSFTFKACETTCAAEVMNSVWTRGKHRIGLERPHFIATESAAVAPDQRTFITIRRIAASYIEIPNPAGRPA
jgi:hypothetical protein